MYVWTIKFALFISSQSSNVRFMCYDLMTDIQIAWKNVTVENESTKVERKVKTILGGARNTGFAMINIATMELTTPA